MNMKHETIKADDTVPVSEEDSRVSFTYGVNCDNFSPCVALKECHGLNTSSRFHSDKLYLVYAFILFYTLPFQCFVVSNIIHCRKLYTTRVVSLILPSVNTARISAVQMTIIRN